MTLAEFLEARWDEREAAARATGDGKARTWSAESDIHPDAWRVIDGHGEVIVYDEGAPSEAEAAHIALNDPAAVLADIDAKRKLLASITEDRAESLKGDPVYIDPYAADRYLKLMALPFATHPDYRKEEWAP
jgi:Family of unknown function (DUF6221)